MPLTLTLSLRKPLGQWKPGGFLHVPGSIGCAAVFARCIIVAVFENETQPERPVRSYSQLNTWLQCPRQYQLERVVRVPRLPGWWFPGGTAVHATVERYLRQSLQEGK